MALRNVVFVSPPGDVLTVEGLDGVYLAVAFGGGGFKVAPAVGEAVAAEIVAGERRAELAPWLAGRVGMPLARRVAAGGWRPSWTSGCPSRTAAG